MKFLILAVFFIAAPALAADPVCFFVARDGEGNLHNLGSDKKSATHTEVMCDNNAEWGRYTLGEGEYAPTQADIDAQFKRRVCDANPELLAVIGTLFDPTKTADQVCDLMKGARP